MNLKRLLKNKLTLSLMVIADIIFCIFIITKVSIIKGSIILFVSHLALIYFIFIHVFKVNLINFNKLVNNIKNKIIKKKLGNNSYYLKKIDIKTFDGSGSLTHPSTLHFEQGFNGYKFWMVYTPYDNNNVELENPCIAVSNDGKNWEEPVGLKNPLLPIIKKQKPNTYYNDPFLLYTDKLEIWYRHTVEKENLIDNIYRITSVDGIHWSKPERMIKHDGSGYLSLSIVKKNNKYYLYYFNTNYKFNLRISEDLINWSKEYEINVDGFIGDFWHGEVKIIGENVYLLFMDKTYNLYFAESNDLKSFHNCRKMLSYYCPNLYLYSNISLYKSSFIFINDMIYFYIPFRINIMNLFRIENVMHKKWEITLTKINKKKLNIIFKKEGIK